MSEPAGPTAPRWSSPAATGRNPMPRRRDTATPATLVRRAELYACVAEKPCWRCTDAAAAVDATGPPMSSANDMAQADRISTEKGMNVVTPPHSASPRPSSAPCAKTNAPATEVQSTPESTDFIWCNPINSTTSSHTNTARATGMMKRCGRSRGKRGMRMTRLRLSARAGATAAVTVGVPAVPVAGTAAVDALTRAPGVTVDAAESPDVDGAASGAPGAPGASAASGAA